MSGTRAGGLKSAARNRELYGKEYYVRIGKKGGAKTGMKGFALNREAARIAGQKGGQSSRRGKALPKVEDESIVHPEAG